ncbi:MAG: heme-binding domain-containing protein [Prolixibacteraceae bacterium]|nr:heme-binding domain-containing protein [Prolixibacteraceae bacterium]
MKTNKLMPLFALLAMILLAAFTLVKPTTILKTADEKNNTLISADAKSIIDQSCVGCHNAESKNDKGKTKLMFESLDTLSTARLIAKLEAIHEVVNEGSMPPAKFLEFKPEAALSDAQKTALLKWADESIESRLKKN